MLEMSGLSCRGEGYCILLASTRRARRRGVDGGCHASGERLESSRI